MRFTSAILALPILAAAEEGGVFGQYRAQFQNLLGSLGVAQPATGEAATSSAAAAAASTGSATTNVQPAERLTLSNWKDTLTSSVQPDATTPEEWLILVTGRNKTCFGHCGIVETSFEAATPKLASIPNGPHLGLINCDDEPVLCNSWSASPGFIYLIDLLPKPAKTDIYYKRLNLTTTTPETIVDLYQDKSRESFRLLDGYFHPFDGVLAANGLAVPVGYILWFFNVVPNWLFMVGVSFISRTMMGRRLGPNAPGGPGRAPGAPGPQ